MKVTCIVLDGVGVGELPDADEYGDAGSDTLGHVSEAVGGLRLPRLGRLGLGNLHRVRGVPPVIDPRASFGRMVEASPGKDSTTGHWELAGVILDRPFPTYPDGFPEAIVREFQALIGREVIGNVAASGTVIIEELGDRHVATGKPILYTSADSVFQIAAHEDVIPLEELYRYCALARRLLQGEHGVGRVIARPFVGTTGQYRRTGHRKDFSLPPPKKTLLDTLTGQRVPVLAVGKIDDLFAGRGVTDSFKTGSNREGLEITIGLMKDVRSGFIFTNLIDFDTLYGHRNDPAGFAASLAEFDDALDELTGRCERDDMLVVTADHGNDPTTASTDHAREHVPLLIYWPRGKRGVDLGTRATFADLGATLAEIFGVDRTPAGRSFLEAIR